MSMQATLWVIDDDPALRLILEDAFSDAGLIVHVFSSAKGAWAKLNDVLHKHQPDSLLPQAILTDIRMPMMDGLSFSEWVHKYFPNLPIIIMTAHSDLKSAVDSYQTGAFDYLPKPFDLDDAINVIQKAIAKNKAINPNTIDKHTKEGETQKVTDDLNSIESSVSAKTLTANKSLNNSHSPSKPTKVRQPLATTTTTLSSGIIGQSVVMQTVFRAVGRLANSPITVLITGESGTGKELVAQALHQNSPRHNNAFIALNMAALPHDLIESELFGHEKGAFTGATTQRQGRFEQADGGTLFLDEIGDMPFSTQTRLLRVLANGEFFRVGGHKPIKVDVRIIAATHQNLEQLVKQGSFREDLFYRLNVIRLPLPPLRDRPEDIPDLVDYFMARVARELNSDEKIFLADAMQLMQKFKWAGNVRQLENACRWVTVMATGNQVTVADLPPELTEFANEIGYINNDLQSTSASNITHTNTNVVYSNDLSYNNSSSDYTSTLIPSNSLHQISAPRVSIESTAVSNKATSTTTQSKPLVLKSEHTLSWMQALQEWGHNALNQGEMDVLQLAMPKFEQVLIELALKHTNGRKGEAAELLGWGRNTLTRKMKLFNDKADAD